MIIFAVQAALATAAAKVGAAAIDQALEGFTDLRTALAISRADLAVVEALMAVAATTQAELSKQQEIVAQARTVANASRERITRALGRINTALPDAAGKVIGDANAALLEVVKRAGEVLPDVKGALVTHGFVWMLGAGAALFVMYKVFVKGSPTNG